MSRSVLIDLVGLEQREKCRLALYGYFDGAEAELSGIDGGFEGGHNNRIKL